MNISLFKTIFVAALAALFSVWSPTAQASNFYDYKSIIGCGTITSVRPVNQAPLYDAWYELKHAGNKSVIEIAVNLSGLGYFSMTSAAVGGALIDAARGQSSELEGVKAPATGDWKEIVAVQIKMETGEILNLPLTAATTRFTTDANYQVGMVVPVYYIKDRESIQVSTKFHGKLTSADIEAKTGRYALTCKRRATDEDAAKVFAAGANMVQEDKILPAN